MVANYLGKLDGDGPKLAVAELEKAFSGVQTFPWVRLEASRPAAERKAACLALADRFDQRAAAGRGLSERLAMRYFSHVGRNAAQATFAA